MKQNTLLVVLALSLTAALSSCEVAGGIFKAGMWMGVIIVVIVIALVLWLLNKMRK